MLSTSVRFKKGFHVLIGDGRSQAATLVIQPGAKVGGPQNRHGGADQWIYVEDGEGMAEIAGEILALARGSLVLIQRGESHGFRNTGEGELRILTFYVPPAYDENEKELPAGLP
ncbi:MAG: cupin domain-containing protein [Hyphomicrobium sp.]|nr:cupin domain-containing protein [Hyphomicrobium sp.]